jgi:RNA polymerase sigma-70 factor (ECF subfamily)
VSDSLLKPVRAFDPFAPEGDPPVSSVARHRFGTAVADPVSFDTVVLPHLGAAYRLARWLVGNEHDAEDIVQEASLRALRYFETYSGGNDKAWFLRIVRNLSYDWRDRRPSRVEVFDEEQHSATPSVPDPESRLLHVAHLGRFEHAVSGLPARFRELIVLRALDDLSYQEMADVLGAPVGTVMSGLSRARQALRRALLQPIRRVVP